MKKLAVFFAVLMLFAGIAYGEEGRLVKGSYVQECVELPLSDFWGDGATPTELTTSSTPQIQEDDGMPAIVWTHTQSVPIYKTFRVPENFDKEGRFRVMLSSSATTTKNYMDFDYLVHAPNAAVDTTTTDQTAVTAATSTAGYTYTVELVPTDTFNAGDWVTLRLFPGSDSYEVDTELKGAVFCYTPK